MTKKRIPYVALGSQWDSEKEDLLKIINKVMSEGQYVGGRHVDLFEKNIAKLCDVKYAASFNSGTDALTIALSILGIKKGDEVLTTPNSFIASTAVIVHLGAKPVFVDTLPDQNIDPNKIEGLISKKTKAIMPVHLTGRISEMQEINKIARKYNLFVIEDAAQAVGSKYKNKMSGSLGHVGCFSTHPLKNLNASGDGGFLTTNNKKIWEKAKLISNHGMSGRDKVEKFGFVSRMDNLQAAILNYRMKKLKKVINQRRKNAKFYMENLNRENVFFPDEKDYQFNSYHTFVIQVKDRDGLKKFLKSKGIDTAIHYPIPIHLQPAAEGLNYKAGDFPQTEKQARSILTLPINQFLSTDQLEYITKNVNDYVNRIQN